MEDQRHIVATEHRYKKTPRQNSELKSNCDELANENLVYPWEKREKMDWKHYRNQISRKPHQEYRHELLIWNYFSIKLHFLPPPPIEASIAI